MVSYLDYGIKEFSKSAWTKTLEVWTEFVLRRSNNLFASVNFNTFLVIPPTVGSVAWQSVWAGEGMSSLSRTMLFWCYCHSTLSQIIGAFLGTNVKVCFFIQSINLVTLSVFVADLRIRINSQWTTVISIISFHWKRRYQYIQTDIPYPEFWNYLK